MPTDIEIAHQTKLRHITDVAEDVGLRADDLELYGSHKAKVTFDAMKRVKTGSNRGKMILVTAITPTPAGEGKTTVSIGLNQALWKIGKKSIVALREPSLGPVFGIKGGATGGGYSQVLPMEDINLHFTGDLHAVTSAHNLLIAMLDSHLHHGNEKDIDIRSISMKRTLDLCDRALKNTIVGIGGRLNGVPRESSFEITAASEVMAVVALSTSIRDMKEKLGKIVVAETSAGKPVTAADLNAVGAMAATLRDALKPNLVQTVEGCPALIHMGPFGNVSIGCNSIMATDLGLHLCDYLVTEAGFGSDLGAEKFLNIKCRAAGIMPDAVVVAATVRALKYQGGVAQQDLTREDLDALKTGIPNLLKHIENMQAFGLNVVCAVNRFSSDTDNEIQLIRDAVESMDVPVALADVWAKGGDGGTDLAGMVVNAVNKPSDSHHLYADDLSIEQKIEKVARSIYGAKGIRITPAARKKIAEYEEKGYGRLPVCIAKTQKSLSDQASLMGRPEGFTLTVNDVRAAVGAGYIVVYAGNISTMFGLAKKPAAESIDLTDTGEIVGIF